MVNPMVCSCEKEPLVGNNGLTIKYEDNHEPATKKAFNTLYIDSKNVKQYVYDSAGNYVEVSDGYATEQYVDNHHDTSKLDTVSVSHETWQFTLSDDTVVEKEVMLWQG